jgi:hypothetical protein
MAAGLAVVASASPAAGATAGGAAGRPAWARGLGPGVVLSVGRPTRAGHASPAAAVTGDALEAGNGALRAACAYLEPAVQAACRASVAGEGRSDGPTVADFGLGWVAVDGSRALVGTTGTFCLPDESPACFTNHRRDAVFRSGRRFAVLYRRAVAAEYSSANVYSLIPCERVAGRWYVYVPD